MYSIFHFACPSVHLKSYGGNGIYTFFIISATIEDNFFYKDNPFKIAFSIQHCPSVMQLSLLSLILVFFYAHVLHSLSPSIFYDY